MKEAQTSDVTKEQRILKRVLARELTREQLETAVGSCQTISYTAGQPGDIDEAEYY